MLTAYSAGEVPRRNALARLDLPPDAYPEFVDDMNRMAVPWPRPDPAQIEREAAILAEAIAESRGQN